MADEQVEKKDVNGSGSESSTGSSQTEGSNPPAEESSVESRSENRIPLPRFNEVIQERNRERQLREQYESRLRDLEQRLPTKAPGEEQVERLVKSGVDPKVAKEIIDVSTEASRRERQALESQRQAANLQMWHRDMESKYKDYREMAPVMEREFSNLSPNAQMLAVSDPAGLEMLYAKAKASLSIDGSKKAFDEGAKQAYNTKDQKRAISSTPGSSSKGGTQEVSLEYLASIRGNTKEYRKNLDRINHWLKTGKQL